LYFSLIIGKKHSYVNTQKIAINPLPKSAEKSVFAENLRKGKKMLANLAV
jgi:hypothetical protein